MTALDIANEILLAVKANGDGTLAEITPDLEIEMLAKEVIRLTEAVKRCCANNKKGYEAVIDAEAGFRIMLSELDKGDSITIRSFCVGSMREWLSKYGTKEK